MCVFYLSERNRVQRWGLSCHKNSKSYQVFWICLISVRTTYSRLTQTNTHTISLLIYTKKHFIPQEQVLEKRKSSFSPLPSDFELQSENRRIAIRILIWPRSTRSICPRNDLKQRFIVALLTECVIDDFFWQYETIFGLKILFTSSFIGEAADLTAVYVEIIKILTWWLVLFAIN